MKFVKSNPDFISRLKSSPVSSPEFNVESFPPNDITLFPPIVSHSYDISANPSGPPLSFLTVYGQTVNGRLMVKWLMVKRLTILFRAHDTHHIPPTFAFVFLPHGSVYISSSFPISPFLPHGSVYISSYNSRI